MILSKIALSSLFDDDGVQHHDEDDRELDLHLLEPQPHPLAHGDLRRGGGIGSEQSRRCHRFAAAPSSVGLLMPLSLYP